MENSHGILPALVTPIDGDRVFQARPYEQLLERVYSEGVHGVYVCGQTGEGLQLPRETRERATECVVLWLWVWWVVVVVAATMVAVGFRSLATL